MNKSQRIPEQLERLRIKDEYGNPPVIITENGAGFPGDDELEQGQVVDERRSSYILNHISAMKSAIAKGANVCGYHVWSSHNKLEGTSGYERRCGIIYVDFVTQQRILKQSALDYSSFIREYDF